MDSPGLHLVPRPDHRQAAAEPVHVGRAYPVSGFAVGQVVDSVLVDPDVCVGGYRVTRGQAVALPPMQQVFVWNPDAAALAGGEIERLWGPDRRLACNRLTISSSGLDGPFLTTGPDGASLTMNAEFELEWQTGEQAAVLGAVETVEAQRSVRYVDGDTQLLLDTAAVQGPVRYVHPDADDRAIREICPLQPLGQQTRQRYRASLAQSIPEQIDGRAVSDITVLEQYSCYFMQCENPDEPERHIWVPLLAPLLWGWSIRVGHRTDGEWGILRRKLLMPTSRDEGLVLPVWESDTGTCMAN